MHIKILKLNDSNLLLTLFVRACSISVAVYIITQVICLESDSNTFYHVSPRL